MNNNEHDGALGAASDKREDMSNTAFLPIRHDHTALLSLQDGSAC